MPHIEDKTVYVVYSTVGLSSKRHPDGALRWHEGGHGFSHLLEKAMWHDTLESAQDRLEYATSIYGAEYGFTIVKVTIAFQPV